MEWRVNIKIDGCDEVFALGLDKGCIGTFVAEIPDEQFDKMTIVEVTESLITSAKEYRDEMIKIQITPMGE